MVRRPTAVNVSFLLLGTLAAALLADPARGDIITFSERGFSGRQAVEGNVLATTAAGVMVVEGRDGRHWVIRPGQVERHEKSQEPVALYTADELATALASEYGDGFRIHRTKNYIIVYSTSEEFAEDAGKLFERIKSVFENYMRRQAGFEPSAPAQPMVAVIFKSQEEFVRRMQPELGPIAKMSAGVYVPATNRMFMFDMLGGRDEEWLSRVARVNRRSPDEIALLLATDTISTVIHEGIHQVAFNTGFHNREIRNPLWLVEGLATLMEVPEIESKTRWAGIGQINWDRAGYLKDHWKELPADSLRKLVAGDEGLRDARSAQLAYAQAWALTYFLTKTKKKAYMEYVRRINERAPLAEYPRDERERDFREAFSMTPTQMEGEFRRYVEKSIFTKKKPDAR